LPINNNFSLSQNSFYNTISGTYADYFSAWDKWEKKRSPVKIGMKRSPYLKNVSSISSVSFN
ncbi:hypothetical protein EG503_23055, partial [Shigella sonnei]|nr:hypothetical protein [Shigella sonnei]